MKTKNLLLSLLLASFYLAGLSASAATPAQSVTSQKATRIATVNIHAAEIIGQEKNKLQIIFDLSNGAIAQPEVRYAVQLIRQDGKAQSIADEKIYSEVINLNANEAIKKDIDYTAPDYLNGKFQVWLIAKNVNGLILSSVNPGEVTLSGGSQYAEIKASSCYLKVSGEAGDKKYTPSQGVDIGSEEKIIATCDVMNYSNTALTLTPQIKTYWRSTFGKLVEDNNEPQYKLTFEPKKQKTISLTLPKAKTPQAYDAVLVLTDNQNKTLSNQITFHYVLRGVSATIQNFTLDKNAYKKGETANASFLWSAAADGFPDSRLGIAEKTTMFLQVEIKDKNGKNCIAPTNETLDGVKSMADFKLPIIADCTNPKISISIKDASGNILDKKDYAWGNEAKSIKKPGGAENEKTNTTALTYGIILIVVLMLISFTLIYFKKNGNKNISKLSIFLILLAGGLFLTDCEVRAETFTVDYRQGVYCDHQICVDNCAADPSLTYCAGAGCSACNGCIPATASSQYGSIYIDVTLNNDTYALGEEIKASGSTPRIADCGNSATLAVTTTLFSGDSVGLPHYVFYGSDIFSSGGEISYITGTYIGKTPSGIPSSVGTYYANFKGNYSYTKCSDSHEGTLAAPGIKYVITASQPTCTGTLASVNVDLCTGDDTGLTSSTARTLVATCSSPTGSSPKCQYTCKAGFTLSGGTCVPVTTPQCTGLITDPNAELCTGDDVVTIDTSSTLVPACTPTKCEHVCKAGFTLSSGTCVPVTTPQCTGSITDPNAELCTGDDVVTIDTSSTLVPACTPTKCEHVCKAGFTLSGGVCTTSCAHGHSCSVPSCTVGVCETLLSTCVANCSGDCAGITCPSKTCPCSSGQWQEK